MSGFLLDTNIPSETVRRVPDTKVLDWLDTRSEKEVDFISVITLGELRRGAALLTRSARRTELEHFIEIGVDRWFGSHVLPVTRQIADRWGALDALRQLAGRPMSTADGLIAATALEHGLTLVTRNVKDFSSLGVPIFNPWDQ